MKNRYLKGQYDPTTLPEELTKSEELEKILDEDDDGKSGMMDFTLV